MLGNQRIVLELGIGNLGARLKDRVARIGNQNSVARIEQGQAQMAHALLRAVARLHHGRVMPETPSDAHSNRTRLA